jgi:hypothetical protein
MCFSRKGSADYISIKLNKTKVNKIATFARTLDEAFCDTSMWHSSSFFLKGVHIWGCDTTLPSPNSASVAKTLLHVRSMENLLQLIDISNPRGKYK